MQCSRSDARLTTFSSDDCFHLICLKPAMHQLQEVQDKDMPARPARPTSGSNCSFPLANLRFLKKPSFTLYSKSTINTMQPSTYDPIYNGMGGASPFLPVGSADSWLGSAATSAFEPPLPPGKEVLACMSACTGPILISQISTSSASSLRSPWNRHGFRWS